MLTRLQICMYQECHGIWHHYLFVLNNRHLSR